jgi:hypothetical protein
MPPSQPDVLSQEQLHGLRYAAVWIPVLVVDSFIASLRTFIIHIFLPEGMIVALDVAIDAP